uniref:AlNc14C513G12009 protein n=1 Tax=Albugo laibachii Nc14 TaxID=890382 RepID=F0X0R5_9STRA|nr:AlNc14C513G12009 [Albugo laibachii Nc14]|eukprot:CCA27359.1 AlNc14C513G12009 [Albugo laibachii Nc14]
MHSILPIFMVQYVLASMRSERLMEDCLSCKLIGTMTLAGLSGYFYHQSRKVPKTLKTQRHWLQFCSACFLLAGIARAKPANSKATDPDDLAC